MKVVVDIPNWLYNAIMEHKEPVYSQSLGEAVRNGTPLPKGHGRLIDTNDIDYYEVERYGEPHYMCWKKHIDGLRTIIEADIGETE